MIDLRVDQPYAPEALCECGDAECLGDAKWFAKATADIAAQPPLTYTELLQLTEQAPGLNSPLLRLAKERNAARELVKKLLYTAHLGDDSQDKFDALSEAHKAVFQWKGGAK